MLGALVGTSSHTPGARAGQTRRAEHRARHDGPDRQQQHAKRSMQSAAQRRPHTRQRRRVLLEEGEDGVRLLPVHIHLAHHGEAHLHTGGVGVEQGGAVSGRKGCVCVRVLCPGVRVRGHGWLGSGAAQRGPERWTAPGGMCRHSVHHPPRGFAAGTPALLLQGPGRPPASTHRTTPSFSEAASTKPPGPLAAPKQQNHDNKHKLLKPGSATPHTAGSPSCTPPPALRTPTHPQKRSPRSQLPGSATPQTAGSPRCSRAPGSQTGCRGRQGSAGGGRQRGEGEGREGGSGAGFQPVVILRTRRNGGRGGGDQPTFPSQRGSSDSTGSVTSLLRLARPRCKDRPQGQMTHRAS